MAARKRFVIVWDSNGFPISRVSSSGITADLLLDFWLGPIAGFQAIKNCGKVRRSTIEGKICVIDLQFHFVLLVRLQPVIQIGHFVNKFCSKVIDMIRISW